MDFTGIEGSLTDLKLILELEGLVPFNWRNKAKLESFDSRMVDKFLKGLKNKEEDDLIKIIYYNFKSKKFEIGELYHLEWYWDGEDLNTDGFDGSWLVNKVITFRTSNEDIYHHIITNKTSDNDLLEFFKLDSFSCLDLHWEFFKFDLTLKDPYLDEDRESLNYIRPILFYINMN